MDHESACECEDAVVAVDTTPVDVRWISQFKIAEPPRWLNILIVALGVSVLVGWSGPGIPLLFLFVALAGVASMMVWLGWAMLFVAARGSWSWKLAIVPILVLLIVLALVTSGPSRARWALSETAFNEVIAALPERNSAPPSQSPDPVGVPLVIGLYVITDAERLPEGVMFYEAGGDILLNRAGFAYLPNFDTDVQEVDADVSFTRLSGSWYSFIDRF